jgi:hypothetical protein
VLPRQFPDLINDDQTILENSFVVPDAALADVPGALRGPAEPARGAQPAPRGTTRQAMSREWNLFSQPRQWIREPG